MSGKTSFEEMLGLGVVVGVFHTSLLTTGFPSVTVPVLSSTTVFTFLAISRLSASFIRIPDVYKRQAAQAVELTVTPVPPSRRKWQESFTAISRTS